jgi:hypothetical protein
MNVAPALAAVAFAAASGIHPIAPTGTVSKGDVPTFRMLLLCQFQASRRGVAVDRHGPRAARWSAGGDGGRGVGLE